MKLTEKHIYWLIIGIVFIYLFNLLSPILGPFIFSVFLAYLGDPIADRLEKKMSRTLAVTFVFVTILLILILTIAIFIPLVSKQLDGLLHNIPQALEFIHNKIIPFLEEKLQYKLSDSKEAIVNIMHNNMNDISTIANKIFKWFAGSGGYLFSVIANIFLIPVVTFYLLRDWDILIAKINTLLPRQQEPKIKQIAKESNEMLSSFLRGQFVVMNALSLIYAIGLSIVGLDSAILLGFIAGWLSFVPYLGLIVGISVATIMAYFQFNDFMHPLGVTIVFIIAQALEGSVLTPKFVGERIGLHPVMVIFSILAGGQLAGFMGVLLALPVAAVLNVLISHMQVAYQQSRLYNKLPK